MTWVVLLVAREVVKSKKYTTINNLKEYMHNSNKSRDVGPKASTSTLPSRDNSRISSVADIYAPENL